MKKIWRFKIERPEGLGWLIIRLPFNVGVSFWQPYLRLLVGVCRNDIGIEWSFLCFAGEVWVEEKYTPEQLKVWEVYDG
jgi:hypothetical protein